MKTNCLCILVLLIAAIRPALAQTTAFTYQGKLSDGGIAANGNYDLRFAFFDSLANGAQIGATQTVANVVVSAGIFTVQLDFGASAFPGANRFLEIGARVTGTATFTTLAPRQPITSTPYAIRSLNASSADTVTVNGVPSGSGNYIQSNPASQQAGNFNISGNGTAGTLSAGTITATTQYNIGGSRLIFAPNPTGNLFVGRNSGGLTTGVLNSFFGNSSGSANTTGQSNCYFGNSTGFANTTGDSNSFFGAVAGNLNTIGARNSFFGASAGQNSQGDDNTLVGAAAGFSNSGSSNSFFGTQAGGQNISGSRNTLIGAGSNVGSGALLNSTAIGWFSQVDQSNSLVLGSILGVNGANASVNVGIGTTTPQAALDVIGAGVFRPGGAGSNRSTSLGSPNGETGITIHGPSNRADVRFDGSKLKLVAALGDVPPAETNGIAITTTGDVGIGNITPNAKLDVNGNIRLTLAPGGSLNVCLTGLIGNGLLAQCGSSLRYKTSVRPFSGGLDLIGRFRPIYFTWKDSGIADFGLGAEDVAKIEPLLVTHNDQGEIEGVKYDRLNVVLINAIKQQQEQISRQQEEIAGLKKLVCLNRRRRGVCKRP